MYYRIILSELIHMQICFTISEFNKYLFMEVPSSKYFYAENS